MILGFTGKMQSGKSTAVTLSKGMLDSWVTANFKDGLKKELVERFPDVINEILMEEGEWCQNGVSDLFIKKPPVFRALMQNFGTEVRRKDNPDHWVDIWKRTVLKHSDGVAVLCDDVRFLNEAKAVKDLGGYVIRIVRPGLPTTSTHQSEIEMDQIEPDYTIIGEENGHDKLQAELKKVIDEIQEKGPRS